MAELRGFEYTFRGYGIARHQPSLAPPAPAWHAQRGCADVDPEIFYPAKGGSVAPAIKVCNACPVRETCLEDTLAFELGIGLGDIFGVIGGLTPKARRKLRDAADKAAA